MERKASDLAIYPFLKERQVSHKSASLERANRSRPGGKRRVIENQEGIYITFDGSLTFKLLPPLSPLEVELISEQWRNERLVKEADRYQRASDEIHIQQLMQSERAQYLIEAYRNIAGRPFQGIREKLISSLEDVIIISRFVIANMLPPKIDNNEFKKRLLSLERDDFEKAKIFSLIENQFSNYHEMLIAAYPLLNLQPYQFRRVPQGYWQKETCNLAIRWLVEEELDINKIDPIKFREDIQALPIQKAMQITGISSCVDFSGYESIADAMIGAYPELKFKSWELGKTHWSKRGNHQQVIEATKWLVEERLGLSPIDPNFRNKVTKIPARCFNTLLGGMLSNEKYGGIGSHIKAILITYAEFGLKPEEFTRFSPGYWNRPDGYNIAISYVRNLVENTFGFNPKNLQFRQQLKEINRTHFMNAGLRGMLRTVFGQSVSKALLAAYPTTELKIWECASVPNNFWQQDNHENVGKAVRWAVEEKLEIHSDHPQFRTLLASVTRTKLEELGLDGMFVATKLSLVDVLRIAYPEILITCDELVAANSQRSIDNLRAPLIEDKPLTQEEEIMLQEYETALLNGQITSYEEFMKGKQS